MDVFGRGLSDWLPEASLYAVPTYAAGLSQLLARLPGPADWVGTSMGGLIGLVAAARPGAVRRLVLNDVGPRLPAAALARIAERLAERPVFDDEAGLEAHLRRIHAAFGPLPDAYWRHLAATSARRTAEGRVVPHFDPGIASAFRVVGDLDLHPLWSSLRLPVLVLRGAESDLLEAADAAAMARRPGNRLVTFAGCGHAPALWETEQIAPVLDFLEG